MSLTIVRLRREPLVRIVGCVDYELSLTVARDVASGALAYGMTPAEPAPPIAQCAAGLGVSRPRRCTARPIRAIAQTMTGLEGKSNTADDTRPMT